jgi:hypothetical protein
MMHARHWYRATMLAAIFFVAAAGRTAFADETSAGVSIPRGTPPPVQQTQRPQEIQVVPPPLPSCDSWPYSHFLFDYCFRPRDPLKPSRPEINGTLGRSGTATIDLHQCGVGGCRHSGTSAFVSASALRANADGGVCDYGIRMSATYRLQWR